MSITIKGCKLYVSFWLVAFLALASALDKSGYVFCAVLASFIHESGHIVAMAIKNRLPNNVKIGLFNVSIIDKLSFSRNYAQDIFILLAGSLFNFIITILFFILFIFYKSELIVFLMGANFFIGIFNLLPIYALDGGSILFLLLNIKLNQEKSIMIVKITSFIILLPISFIGFLILLQSYYNISLLLISCYLMFLIIVKKEI